MTSTPMRQGHRVVLWLVLLLFIAPLATAMEENTDFQPPHEGVDFPVGWTEFNLNGPFSPEVRMVYPAMVNGEDKDMAGNGPFPWVVLIGDSGEAIDGYMLLVEPIVQRGYIVVVSQPLADETDVENTIDVLDIIMSHMEYQNQTNAYVMGSASNIDVEHWGLLGHGKGATAAYLAFPFWDLSTHATDHQPPRALVGMAMDFEDLDEDFVWEDIAMNPVFSTPGTALFMTGTVDEVAPSQETMERVDAIGGLSWQWMHVLGADHYQFQDTRSIFENDGDATMSQSAQINFAVEHSLAYLDTVLRGDHASFREAFNRPEGPRTVSDGSAYVDEDLQRSAFLRWTNVSLSHDTSQPLNASNTLVLEAQWALRNGDGIADLPAGWDVHVSCGWLNAAWQTAAALDSNGTARCEYPMAPVAPGQQKAWMSVEVEGAPSTMWASVQRTNTPVELLYPQVTVYVPQHGEATLNISDVAVDPDGQAVRALNATLTGPDASHFAALLDESGQFLTVRHALEEEWLGECRVELHMRSDGGVADEINTSLRVMLTPVDDQVVKDGTVPIQEMDEDGAPVVFDLSTVVSDPEGETLLIRVGGQATGEQGPVRYVIDDHYITLTPLENQNGATVLRATASDGSNPPVDVDIPVVVNAVNDPVVVNLSQWAGDAVMDEDTTFTLDLNALAYDVDGDPLTWTLEGTPPSLSVLQTNASMSITPDTDVNGVFDGLWLNVTDGLSSHTFSFGLTVSPVGDLPFLSISTIERISGGSSATIQWNIVDVDGVANTNAEVSIDGALVATNHSCIETIPGSHQCVTLISLGETSNTSLFVQLKVTDLELDRSVIADLVFDPNAGGSTPSEETQSEDTSSSSVGLLAMLGILAVALLGVVVFILSRLSSPPVSSTELLEEEPPASEASGSGGLLARASRLK